MLSIDDINTVMQQADCLYDDKQVQQSLDHMALLIKKDLEKENPVFISVLTGAMVPVGHLLTRIDFPLELDYIHATRYDGELKGTELKWLVEPRCSLKDRVVVIVDDIYDEGYTLEAIINYCESKGAAMVKSAVLVEKEHNRGVKLSIDYVGLKVPDRYVFGYGMDYKGYLRNVNGIYAVKGL